jgi:hypothetical protein
MLSYPSSLIVCFTTRRSIIGVINRGGIVEYRGSFFSPPAEKYKRCSMENLESYIAGFVINMNVLCKGKRIFCDYETKAKLINMVLDLYDGDPFSIDTVVVYKFLQVPMYDIIIGLKSKAVYVYSFSFKQVEQYRLSSIKQSTKFKSIW